LPPSFLSPSQQTEYIDKEAILSSIEQDGKILPRDIVAGEYTLTVDGGYMRLAHNPGEKQNTPITIKSSVYNKIKTTPFRLPRNISLTPSDIPKSLSIFSNAEPKNQLYDVEFYGLPE
jgi:hypothetical protein